MQELIGKHVHISGVRERDEVQVRKRFRQRGLRREMKVEPVEFHVFTLPQTAMLYARTQEQHIPAPEQILRLLFPDRHFPGVL